MALVIDPLKNSQIDWVINFLKSDCPVALPTETVYGLAGRVYAEKSLSQIFALKARPHFDPLIAHVSGIEMARDLCDNIGAIELELMKRFWPGPLTILLKKSDRVPDLCTAASPFVAVRCPAHPVFASILKTLGEPLAAPSANRFQGISPTTYQAVLDELGPFGLEAVVDGGNCQHGIESTVVRFQLATNTLEVLRPGACSSEELQSFCSDLHINFAQAASLLDETQLSSPGQLAKHYSPAKEVMFVSREWIDDEEVFSELEQHQKEPTDCYLFVTDADYQRAVAMGFLDRQHVVLGHDAVEAAANLFATLRSFDANDAYRRLVAFEPSTDGLGIAIADRLRRAAG